MNSNERLNCAFTKGDIKAILLRPADVLLHGVAMLRSKIIFQNKNDLKSFIKSGIIKKENAFSIESFGMEVESSTGETFAGHGGGKNR